MHKSQSGIPVSRLRHEHYLRVVLQGGAHGEARICCYRPVEVKAVREQLDHSIRRFQKYEEHIKRLREIFNNFDVDNSGELDIEELTEAMKQFGQQGTPQEMQELMKEIGKGGDHASFNDFAKVLLRKMNYNDSQQTLESMFNRFDSDGSGTISPQELKGFLKKLGTYFSDDVIDDLIREVDVDGDGEISFEELSQLMNASKQSRHRGPLMEAISNVELMEQACSSLRNVMLEYKSNRSNYCPWHAKIPCSAFCLQPLLLSHI